MQLVQQGEEMQLGQLDMLEASQNAKLQAESETSIKEESGGSSSSSSSRIGQISICIGFCKKMCRDIAVKILGLLLFFLGLGLLSNRIRKILFFSCVM